MSGSSGPGNSSVEMGAVGNAVNPSAALASQQKIQQQQQQGAAFERDPLGASEGRPVQQQQQQVSDLIQAVLADPTAAWELKQRAYAAVGALGGVSKPVCAAGGAAEAAEAAGASTSTGL